MNYVAARGLVASKNSVINEMWWQSCIEGCSWNIPLKEILRMTEIRPFTSDRVLIVENSGVFSIQGDLLLEVPILCSSGQFIYAVWRMLRKLVESQTQLYYVGDMDPEGLFMVQRLIDAFPEHLQTIAMNLATYQKIATKSELSAARIKQLQRIQDPRLAPVAEKIKVTHQIALQEGFLTELMDEIEWEFAE
ncbi:hypothetical protein BAU15_11905 [Enterococcus sp. JM4C]|nr:hypothetical protein BAU15_11905 [Enterococcus sp. JM4C]